ncbi:MAG: class I SAM-dependent methyltransferase [Nocardioidaceae bacterium]
MPYLLISSDPDEYSVHRLTFVPFLPDGSCFAVRVDNDPLRLPSGVVEPDESWLLDASFRIPLTTAGFQVQRVHPFAIDCGQLFVWVDGDCDSHHGHHVDVDWVVGAPSMVAGQLREAGRAYLARVVDDASRSFLSQAEASYYADNRRLLEPAYLKGTTPQQGSGSSSSPEEWRRRREMIVAALSRDGTFLDLGCANGLLMESVHAWASERGVQIEPYGVDFAPGLVRLAQQRLPQWAERIEVGNAIDYAPRSGMRFTFVHLLLDAVPVARRRDLVDHALTSLVEPAGRVLVSHYGGTGDATAAAQVRRLGLQVTGESNSVDSHASTAWVDMPRTSQ